VKAAVLYGACDLRIEDLPKPQLFPGGVLVRVRATGICGTDVGVYDGREKTRYPRVQGHESTGEVVELGEGVEGLSVGDRVVINPALFCGRCRFCLSGLTTLCANGGLLGREMDGTFAEYVVLPVSALHKMPASISFENGTSINVLATVLRSHDRVLVRPGDRVVVIGTGVSGQLHIRLAKLRGAGMVVGVSRSGWKLELAKRYGAHVTIQGKPGTDVVSEVLNVTGGGADVAIECAGAGETLMQSIDVTRPGGTVLAFGQGPENVPDFRHHAVYYKELTVVGSRGMRPIDYEVGISLCSDGKIDLSPLVTDTFGLERLPEVMARVSSGVHKGLRTVLTI